VIKYLFSVYEISPRFARRNDKAKISPCHFDRREKSPDYFDNHSFFIINNGRSSVYIPFIGSVGWVSLCSTQPTLLSGKL